MRKKTLEEMQRDSTLSDIQRMAACSLLKTRKLNGHRNLAAAASQLGVYYPELSMFEAGEYVTDMAEEADDREWTG